MLPAVVAIAGYHINLTKSSIFLVNARNLVDELASTHIGDYSGICPARLAGCYQMVWN